MIDPKKELARRLKKAGSYRKLGIELNASASHLFRVLKRDRPLGDELLKALGFEAETRVIYKRKAKRGV